MLEEDPSCATYGEAYEVHCARTGREPDQPLNHFKRRCCAQNGQLHPDLEVRYQVSLPSVNVASPTLHPLYPSFLRHSL